MFKVKVPATSANMGPGFDCIGIALDLYNEVEAYKDVAFPKKAPELFEEKKSWKDRQHDKDNTKEYTVAGLITEYRVADGFRSGEKVAFVMLEDYTGSYSFRLGDRDYMRLKEKLEVQRFVIMKIKFSQGKDGRVFVNVNDVLELKEAFDLFAKSLSIVVPLETLRESDIRFFQENIIANQGEQKLQFFIKNPEDESVLEVVSMQHHININENLLEVIHQINNYEVFLN